MTFDEAYAHHKRGDVTPHHSCSVCYQAGWEDAILAEREQLLCGIDRIEKLAFETRPPNPYTPEIIMACNAMRAAIRKGNQP